MHYYLILDSDFIQTGAMIQIIQSSSTPEVLQLIDTYNPNRKFTVPRRDFQFYRKYLYSKELQREIELYYKAREDLSRHISKQEKKKLESYGICL